MENNNYSEITQLQINSLIENLSKINNGHIKFNKDSIINICKSILSVLPSEESLIKGYKIDCIMFNSNTNITSILISVLSQIYGFKPNFINYQTDINKIKSEMKSDTLIVSGFDEHYNNFIKNSLNDGIKIYFINNMNAISVLDKKVKIYEKK